MNQFNSVNEKLKDIQDKFNPIVSFCDLDKQLTQQELNEYDKDNFFFQRVICLKDNFNYVGSVTSASSKILSNYISPYNATVVEKLIKAGALFAAKTSLDEFGMGGTNKSALTGPVLNPFDPKRISGGSSGGSAVVVATEAVSFALGSDTGDSVRKPASYCGIVGVKPTYGRISRFGVIPYASSLDHVGYFTSNVKDAACALTTLAGRDNKDMTSLDAPVLDYCGLLSDDVSGKKIAVLDNVLNNVTNPVVKDETLKLIKELEKAGAIITHISLDDDLLRCLLPTYYIIANCEATANHSNLDGINFGCTVVGNDTNEIMINSRTQGFSPMIRKRFIIGSYSLFEENQDRLLRKAQKVRRVISNTFNKVFEEYDVVLAPASGDVAPLLDQKVDNELDNNYMISENFMVFANFLGLPSMTVPMAKIDGLPVGVNITCRKLEEVTMFNVGLKIEELVDFKRWEDK